MDTLKIWLGDFITFIKKILYIFSFVFFLDTAFLAPKSQGAPFVGKNACKTDNYCFIFSLGFLLLPVLGSWWVMDSFWVYREEPKKRHPSHLIDYPRFEVSLSVRPVRKVIDWLKVVDLIRTIRSMKWFSILFACFYSVGSFWNSWVPYFRLTVLADF